MLFSSHLLIFLSSWIPISTSILFLLSPCFCFHWSSSHWSSCFSMSIGSSNRLVLIFESLRSFIETIWCCLLEDCSWPSPKSTNGYVVRSILNWDLIPCLGVRFIFRCCTMDWMCCWVWRTSICFTSSTKRRTKVGLVGFLLLRCLSRIVRFVWIE